MIPVSVRAAARGGLVGALGIAVLLAAGGCAGAPDDTAATTPAAESPASEGVTVIAIGDSIAYNAPGDCPGCTGFVESFADAIAAERGGPLELINRSRHDGAQTSDIRDEVQSGYMDNAIGGADIVIVSAGFNDQPPYGDPGEACYAAQLGTDADAVAAVLATTPNCITTQTEKSAEELAGALKAVRERVPDASILVLTSYNAWAGWPALDAEGPDAAAAATTTIVAALEAWRTAVCDAAAAVDGQCVDLLEPFNGPDGTTPAGDLLAADYTHPSQAGNDLIRDLLLAAEG